MVGWTRPRSSGKEQRETFSQWYEGEDPQPHERHFSARDAVRISSARRRGKPDEIRPAEREAAEHSYRSRSRAISAALCRTRAKGTDHGVVGLRKRSSSGRIDWSQMERYRFRQKADGCQSLGGRN